MKLLLSTLIALASLSGAAMAHPGHPLVAKMGHTHAQKTALVCPVTGDKIASVKAAVGHSTVKGKTYYFCCAACKPMFDKAPSKYIRNAAKGKFDKM